MTGNFRGEEDEPDNSNFILQQLFIETELKFDFELQNKKIKNKKQALILFLIHLKL